MHSFTIVAIAARIASSLAATQNSNNQNPTFLDPIPGPGINRNNGANINPVHNVVFHYGDSTNANSPTNANVSIQMSYPSVMLENIASVSSVICTDTSVKVTFNSLDAFSSANTSWPTSSDFVIVTNHLNGCDSDADRGIFLADHVNSDTATLTVTVSAVRSSINNTASALEVNFKGIDATVDSADQSPSTLRRDSKSESGSLVITYGLPDDTVIFSSSIVTIEAQQASVSGTATISGTLGYQLLPPEITGLTIDVGFSAAANLLVVVSIGEEYTKTAAYSPKLTYSPFGIADILIFGPAVALSFSTEITATAEVDVSGGVSVNIAGATAHLNILSHTSSIATNWTPTTSSSFSLDENVELVIDPSVSISLELAATLLNEVSLSTGITATAELDNEAQLPGPLSTQCPNGLLLTSIFNFNLVAFASASASILSESWSIPLYSYTDNLDSSCFAL